NVNSGLDKMVHQPEVLIAASGLKEEMNSPNVGIVHSTAITRAIALPIRLVTSSLHEVALERLGACTGTGAVLVSVVVLIRAPSCTWPSSARCTRSAVPPARRSPRP